MNRKIMLLSPSAEQILVKMGARIKRARLRRNISAEDLSKLAGISKGTLTSIEKGSRRVSIGAYVAILDVLNMVQDLNWIALDEEGKRQYWRFGSQRRERATKRITE